MFVRIRMATEPDSPAEHRHGNLPRLKTPQLSRVVFGAMAYPGRSRAQQIRVLQCAIDHGMTSIDTAPLYDAGESERIVGEAVAGRRGGVQILSKCGLSWDGEYGEPMFSMLVDGRLCPVRRDSRPVTIARGIDQSLRRLGVDTIDVMQIHHFDARTPLEETLSEMLAAQQAGKIRAIGVSNFPLAQLLGAHSILGTSLFSTQEQFNMLVAARSEALRAFARDNGIAFLAYSPLAQGALTGMFAGNNSPRDWRSNSPFLRPRTLARINAALERHGRALAEANNTSLATISLAWALAQPGVTNVIAGASSEGQCIENARAMHIELPRSDANQLGEAVASAGARGSGPLSTLAAQLARRIRRIRRRLQSN